MLLAIDWGTTSFRAYLFDAARRLVDTVSSAAGIMQSKGGFEASYYTQVGHWLERYEHIAVIASGMITSKQGWVETPYLPCPASLDDLSGNLTRHETSRGDALHFVPGVSQEIPTPNIMRGEETQMAGLHQARAVTAVLPGTHSKWISMQGDTILHFATFMTGEIYAALTEHTILGRLLTDDEDPAGFARGVRDGFSASEQAGGILAKLFGARAMPLLGRMDVVAVRDYISGLLLGTEILEAVKSGFGREVTPVICGSELLVERYENACRLCGLDTVRGKENLAAYGLLRIALAAGLLS